MARKPARSAPLICKIDVTGFAAVMLALLAMFMAPVMSWPDLQPRRSAELPKAHHSVAMPGVDREDAIVIGIARDGKVYLGSDQVWIEQLPTVIHDRLTWGAERKAYLKVDQNAKYGVVLSVLAEVRSAGVEKIGFIVQRYVPYVRNPSP